MFDIKGRQVSSKWAKTAVLLKNEKVAKYIPETRKFSPVNLEEMLKLYEVIVLKPMKGTGGSGIIKVSKLEDGYKYAYVGLSKRVKEWSGLLKVIRRLTGKKRVYLIQRGIDLATIKGRPVDYRVKIQKPGREWLITGMVGRMARPGYFVTNLCKGGRRLTLSHGLSSSIEDRNWREIRNEMRTVARTCTRLLEKRYPGVRKLGYDFGVDKEGQIWIFEVNTNPR